MHGNPELMRRMLIEQHADMLREAERARLLESARDAARGARLHLVDERASLLDRLVQRLKGAVTPARSRTLTGEPAV